MVLATAFGLPPTRPDRLDAFYHRVRPMGLWRRTARRLDPQRQPRRELARALLVAALCALSLFLCLYGVGRMLLPAPDGGRILAAIALIAGAALIPAWWILGIRQAPDREG